MRPGSAALPEFVPVYTRGGTRRGDGAAAQPCDSFSATTGDLDRLRVVRGSRDASRFLPKHACSKSWNGRMEFVFFLASSRSTEALAQPWLRTFIPPLCCAARVGHPCVSLGLQKANTAGDGILGSFDVVKMRRESLLIWRQLNSVRRGSGPSAGRLGRVRVTRLCLCCGSMDAVEFLAEVQVSHGHQLAR